MGFNVTPELIDSIYKGVLETQPWQTFLHRFRCQLGCQAAGMWLRSPFLEQPKLSMRDIDPDYEKLVRPFLNEYHKSSILFRSGISHGEVKVFADVISKDELERSEYHRKFLEPNDMGDGLQYSIEEPGGLQLWIEIGRSTSCPAFGKAEKDFCYALTPYLTRALSIYSKMKRSESEAEIYAELVEQLTVGIIILDRDARVIKVNRLGKNLLDEMDNVALVNDKLHFLQAVDQNLYITSFEKAVQQYERKSSSPGVELLRIKQTAGRDIGLLIKSAVSSQWYEGRGCPAVVVYVCDPAAEKNTREAFVSKLFGLTISEASLAIVLADGMTLAEGAKKLNITENTARTVSKRIFSKTGARRQAELVRLILSSVALLG